MSQTITIFLSQFADDHMDEILALTLCGNLQPLALDAVVYQCAKATEWDDTLDVTNSDDISLAFELLNANAIESITMPVPMLVQLKRETDVQEDGEQITTDTGEQITVFNEVV